MSCAQQKFKYSSNFNMKHITQWLQLRLWVVQTATEVPTTAMNSDAKELKNVPESPRNLSQDPLI